MEARSVLRSLPVREEELLGDARVCVAVLDGPVDLSHPCFADADLTRLDTLVTEPAGRGRMSLHGTHVASLLFGRPGSAVFGMAPRCRGLLLPVFRDAQKGRVPQLDLARAIERAVQEGAHIINISGGERTPDTQADELLARALRLCEDQGVLVVSAVGNDGCECLQVPAAVSSVLAVGALGTDGKPLKINNWGAAYRRNGVLAPGQDIEGAAPGGGRTALTGSSFATPVVSGVAALLVAAQLRAGHGADPKAAAEAILTTAVPTPCSPDEAPECRRRLAGTLDAARAYDVITGRSDVSMAASGGAVAPATTEPPRAPRTRLLAPEAGVSAAAARPSPGTSPTEVSATAEAPTEAPRSETTEEVNAMDNDHTAAAAYEAAEAPEAPEAEVTSLPPPDPTPAGAAEGGAAPPPGAGPAGELPAAETSRAEVAHVEPREGAQAMETNGVEAATEEATGTVEGRQAAVTTPAPPADPTDVRGGHGGGVHPSCGGDAQCACGGGTGSRPLVYAIGTIGFDFRTEARRDTFRQLMPPTPRLDKDGNPVRGPRGEPISDQAKVYDPNQISAYLSMFPWESDKLTWTLELDRTPIYALEAELPVGMDWGGTMHPTAKATYQKTGTDQETATDDLAKLYYPPVSTIYKTFREAIVGQIQPKDHDGRITRVAIPGVLTDRTVRLFSGQVVPVVEVWSRAVATWNESALIQDVVDAINLRRSQEDPPEPALTGDRLKFLKTTVRAVLDKLYYQFRNLGQTSADRALNYAGTNAFQSADTVAGGLLSAKYVPGSSQHFYTVDTIRVTKSPYCRIGSDCQDVTISFMDPENDRRANVNYLFTVDVSDIPPISLAPVHVFLGDV
ncbi:S8 family serine peptidase [Streptomyces sp. NPDC057743]|uniref:cyanobactin maturation protease PatG family protein n=1 Tax=Streptomyces sp. NPDC057743 TaxID=3346236 RepID=UPI0036C8B625